MTLMTRRTLGLLGTIVLGMSAACGGGVPQRSGLSTSNSHSTKTFQWQYGPKVILPQAWEGIGSGAIQGHVYTNVELVTHPVTTVRFWPDLLYDVFLHNDASRVDDRFSQKSAYLIVMETTVDPFPGPVSPSMASAPGVIRRSWSPNHQIFLIGYFGSLAPALAASQADQIGATAIP